MEKNTPPSFIFSGQTERVNREGIKMATPLQDSYTNLLKRSVEKLYVQDWVGGDVIGLFIDNDNVEEDKQVEDVGGDKSGHKPRKKKKVAKKKTKKGEVKEEHQTPVGGDHGEPQPKGGKPVAKKTKSVEFKQPATDNGATGDDQIGVSEGSATEERGFTGTSDEEEGTGSEELTEESEFSSSSEEDEVDELPDEELSGAYSSTSEESEFFSSGDSYSEYSDSYED